jgi:hypothetical protein
MSFGEASRSFFPFNLAQVHMQLDVVAVLQAKAAQTGALKN